MALQQIVVVGASAGGVEALRILVAGLPHDFNAAMFVVLHVGSGADGRSLLAEILTSAGPLPARQPADGEEFRCGQIYVAKPDCHMMLADGHIRIAFGPKENRTRPAINPLFRSAAAAYGPAVTGVILTGMLDDGVAGLAEIKRRGGVAIVQDPATAVFDSMPRSALEHVEADYVAALPDIGRILARLAIEDRVAKEVSEPVERTLLETNCPECFGPLWEERQGKILEYRCRVGHAYSPLALKQEEDDAVERSLWKSLITLENAATMTAAVEPDQDSEEAKSKRNHAELIRQILTGSSPDKK